MDIREEIGKKIKSYRLKQALSQELLAAKSSLHRTYISSVERGERNISVRNLEKISKALEIPLTILFKDI